jgi:hypothetical protein
LKWNLLSGTLLPGRAALETGSQASSLYSDIGRLRTHAARKKASQNCNIRFTPASHSQVKFPDMNQQKDLRMMLEVLSEHRDRNAVAIALFDDDHRGSGSSSR